MPISPPAPDPDWVRSHSRTVNLQDGTRVLFRPVLPTDKERIAAGLGRLSPESRFLRFNRPLAQLSEAELRYLTELDYHDHFAWAALTLDEAGAPGIGVARYVRDTGQSDLAEAAVAVVDDYQGRGVGTLLLSLLAETAREHDIRRFVAYVVPVNATVIDLVRRAGGSFADEGDMLRVEIPIGEDVMDASTRMVLRAAAAGEVEVHPGARQA